MTLVLVAALAGSGLAGELDPPPGPPAPTMKSLEDIPGSWSRVIAGPERFRVVLGGEGVLDRETGRVWQRTPTNDAAHWTDAHHRCTSQTVGPRAGWRLPTAEEMAALADPFDHTGLPAGHPFIDVRTDAGYWTSSMLPDFPNHAYGFAFAGRVLDIRLELKETTLRIWCVRGESGRR